MSTEYPHDIQCSFCGVHRKDARFLIAGPSVYICDACVDMAHIIILEKSAEQASAPESKPESKEKS